MDLVLVHGMGRTPLSMLRLRRRLRRAGHRPILFGYSPTFETLLGATARLVRLIDRRVDTRQYALVGHSLGTVIIRTALGHLQGRAPSACFFLAPPMLACKAARYFSRFRLYRLLAGEMGQLLAQEAFMHQLPMPRTLTRIYAGIGGPRASWLPFGREANDGILSVPEACGRFETLCVRVPSLHTFIMNSTQVFADMARLLESVGPAAHAGQVPPPPPPEGAVMARQIYVNLPVKDLKRSRDFFAALGFGFEPKFSDDKAACMVIGENIFAMLLVESFFKTFTRKAVCDATKSTEVLVCLSCDSRVQVDDLVTRAVAAGGSIPREPQDQGFMYGHAFEDLDGHIWELAYMEPDEQGASCD